MKITLSDEIVRNPSIDELPKIMDIYKEAKEFMIKNNNPNQWKNHFDERMIKEDIKNKEIYIIENNNKEALAVFVMKEGPDKTYLKIDGKWLNDLPYYVIHRVASTFKEHEVLHKILNYAFAFSNNIKIDTYKDNIPMQKALKKEGFIYCGIIYLEDEAEREAYQKYIRQD